MHFIGTATAITVANPTPPGYTPPPVLLQRYTAVGLSGQTIPLYPITQGAVIWLTELTVSWGGLQVGGYIQVVDADAPIRILVAGTIDGQISIPFALLRVIGDNPGFRAVSNTVGGEYSVGVSYYTQLP